MTVPALRSPSYRESVLWQEQADFPDVPATPPQSSDCVVVGAGYAGLSCARDLARAGRSVVVLDAHAVGWGASSRNGGMVIPELKAGPAALERAYGPLGRRMYDDVNEAFDHVEAPDHRRVHRLRLRAAPASCTSRTANRARAVADGHGPRARRRARRAGALRAARGARRRVGSTAFTAGLVIERTGGLHPARFHAGLVRLALAAGASTAAPGDAGDHDRASRGWAGRIPRRTDRGAVDTAAVVVCTNAYADGLLPELRRRVLPVGSFIIATEVLEPDLARSVSPRGRMLVDSKNFLFYWRLTPDRRLLFGGRRSLASSTIPQARDFLYGSMLRVHPQLAGTAWTEPGAATLPLRSTACPTWVG